MALIRAAALLRSSTPSLVVPQRLQFSHFSQHAPRVPLSFEQELAEIDAEAAKKKVDLWRRFDSPIVVTSSRLPVVFPHTRSGSGFSIEGKRRFEVPVGFFGASRIFVPAGRARDLALSADDAFKACVDSTVYRDAMDSLAATSSTLAAAAIRTDLEDVVEAAFRKDIGVWWPRTPQHDNIFKEDLAGVQLFMPSSDPIDFSRQVSTSSSAPQATLAVGELKRSSFVPLTGLPQALIAAGSAAQHLRALGLPLRECVVPFLLSTGLQEQHGAAYLLDGNLPCCVFTSEVMDLITGAGIRRAVACRLAMRSHAEATFALLAGVTAMPAVAMPARMKPAHARAAKTVVSSSSANAVLTAGLPPSATFLVPERYYIKTPAPIHGPSDAAHLHLLHVCEMIQVAREAAAGEAPGGLQSVFHPASAAVLPVARLMTCPPGACRDRDLKDGASPLVFPRLGPEWQDASRRSLPTTLRAAYCNALVESVFWLHRSAGVIHGDLVPANVMWRETGASGGVDVRIVDLDAALHLDAPVPPGAREIVASNGFLHVYHPRNFAPGARAEAAYDWWIISMHVLGAPFDGGYLALNSWLDGPVAAKAARGIARKSRPSLAVEAGVARGAAEPMRPLIAELTERLNAAQDVAAVKGVVTAALRDHDATLAQAAAAASGR